MILDTMLTENACVKKVNFRPRDPSKKFKHVTRISLVQFSASELHKVTSYDHLKVNKSEKYDFETPAPIRNHVASREIMLALVRLPGGLLGEAI